MDLIVLRTHNTIITNLELRLNRLNSLISQLYVLRDFSPRFSSLKDVGDPVGDFSFGLLDELRLLVLPPDNVGLQQLGDEFQGYSVLDRPVRDPLQVLELPFVRDRPDDAVIDLRLPDPVQ